MNIWGDRNIDWLRQHVDVSNGIPSHDTFLRVFSHIDSSSFVDCFIAWIEPVCENNKGTIISIDGKSMRAACSDTQKPLRIVSAWASENNMFLGQVAVDEKSNEITAIPKLLKIPELDGAIATIDAEGCQKKIVAEIREAGADYVIAVKANQPTLENTAIDAFAAAEETGSPTIKEHVTEEKGHGREERRVCETIPAPEELKNSEEWKDVKSVVRVTWIGTEDGNRNNTFRQTRVTFYNEA